MSPAAHLTPSVGPLATLKVVAGQTRQRDITGNIRTYSEHIPNIFRAFPGISGHFSIREDRRVPYRPSSVTASRMARRMRYGPSSREGRRCRIVRRRIACRMACRPITGRPSLARVGDLGVPVVPTVGRAEHPSSAMSRPNSACSRRRHRRFTNIYSFPWPWRSIVARSAARLRRGVGRSRIPIHRAAPSGQPDNQAEHP